MSNKIVTVLGVTYDLSTVKGVDDIHDHYGVDSQAGPNVKSLAIIQLVKFIASQPDTGES